jgi:hypothetical protein
MPVSMVRLLEAAEYREHTAARRQVNWTKVQGDVVRRRRASIRRVGVRNDAAQSLEP